MVEDLERNYHGESTMKKVDEIAKIAGCIFGCIALEGTHCEVVLPMTVEHRPPALALVLYFDLVSDQWELITVSSIAVFVPDWVSSDQLTVVCLEESKHLVALSGQRLSPCILAALREVP